MKKLIVILVVLFLAIPSGKASADFVCDSACVERILSGGISSEEISYYGTGNLLRVLTSYYGGDTWMALRMLNLASNTYTAVNTVNYVYGTQFKADTIGFYQCQSKYLYCEEGQFLGYFQEDDKIYRVICTPGEICQERIILEDEPLNLLNEVFFQSCYYGGPGEWGISCEEVPR